MLLAIGLNKIFLIPDSYLSRIVNDYTHTVRIILIKC